MTVPILQAIQEGRRLLQRGDREGARTLLTQAVRRFPKESELWYWLARSLDNEEHARDALQRALKLDPTFQAASAYLAELDAGVVQANDQTQSSSYEATAQLPSVPPAASVTEDVVELSTSPLAAEEPPSFLLDDKEPTPAEAATHEANASHWSFLEELTGESSPSLPQEVPPIEVVEEAPEEPSWSFLEELEGDFGQEPARDVPVTVTTEGSSRREFAEVPSLDPDAPPVSEDELWQRAEAFLGGSPLAAQPIAAPVTIEPVPISPLGQGALPPVTPVALVQEVNAPERGAFSFLAVPASAAASLPVRTSTPPLTAEQVRNAVAAGTSQRTVRTGSTDKKPRRPARVLLLLTLITLALAGAFAARTFMSSQEGQIARATPAPIPTWVQEARQAQYANDFATAENVLREGLTASPNDVVGLAALSHLLREQGGREQEAVTVAEQALTSVRNLEQRALAAEAFVWAMAEQSQPDLGRMLASAEQAATETPQNPAAQWARALAAAVEGDGDEAREVLTLAEQLSPIEEAAQSAAKQGAVYAQIGDQEAAAESYTRALEAIDYVPWRVGLVQSLRALGRMEEAELNLTQLRAIAPDNPAVLELESTP